MRSNYSNIRYHIYRELSKIQQKRKIDRSLLIDDMTIPIFSGVISACLSKYIEKEISNIILFTLITSFLFLGIIVVSKCVIKIYRNRIRPYFYPLKDQSRTSQYLEEESLAAKFNYEVSYLASTAYSEILKRENNTELRQLKIIDTCFYVNNAIRKIKESLLSYPNPLADSLVSKNKIQVIMNIIYAIIEELRKLPDLSVAFEAEIDRIQIKYDNTQKELKSMYEVVAKSFSGQI